MVLAKSHLGKADFLKFKFKWFLLFFFYEKNEPIFCLDFP